MKVSVAKWRLFAGWRFTQSRDKDLNAPRSAINRFLEDHGRARGLLGHQINNIIKRFRQIQVDRNTREGIDSDLHRVPCPEVALKLLVHRGLTARGNDLMWICALLVMALFWFRASTVAGLRPGDVSFAIDGSLTVSVRVMKRRPEFLTRPAVLSVPDAPAGHPRHTVFTVLHRLLDANPDALCAVGRAVSATAQNGSAASGRLTKEFRRLVPTTALHLPDGAIVASQSFREMGATTAIKAGYSGALACAHGLWRRLATMHDHYFFEAFPFSNWFATVLDWLKQA
eukprot:SAG31_NODE_4352_length_3321_cov_6.948790_3_plen_285_part_00